LINHAIYRTESNKYNEAQNFSNITIINHLWLEECYQQWKMMDCNNSRYTYIPKDEAILDASAGQTHLFIDELALWMDSNIIPKHLSSEVEYNHGKNEDVQEEGYINFRKRRRAAINATRVLNDIVMPDVNAYEREKTRHKKDY
jgi:hypothetical protein